MATSKLTGRELRQLGYPEGKAIGIALKTMESHYKGKSKKLKLDLLQRVAENPAFYQKHEMLAPIAKGLIIKREHNETLPLNDLRIPYQIYGIEGSSQVHSTKWKLP